MSGVRGAQGYKPTISRIERFDENCKLPPRYRPPARENVNNMRWHIRGWPIHEALEHVLQAYEAAQEATQEDYLDLIRRGMSPQQARIYALLEKNKGDIVTLERLTLVAEHVRPDAIDANSIKVQLCKIRKVIKDWGLEVVNVWGVGYMLRDRT